MTLLPEQFNVAYSLIYKHIDQGNGQRIALYSEDVVLTYSDLGEWVAKAGNAFRDAGVLPEQRVLLICRDRVETVVAFLAAMSIAAIPIPVNPNISLDDCNRVVPDSRARIVLSEADSLER